MSNGEGRSEAGNPAVLVVALVVVLNELNLHPLRHLREEASGEVSVGAAVVVSAIEVEAEAEAVASEVDVEDSALAVEALVATAMAMTVEDMAIEEDLAAIGVAVVEADFVVDLMLVVTEVDSGEEETTPQEVVVSGG